MDISIFLGLAVAFFSFFVGVPELREDLNLYLQPNSFLLVFGGTIASTLMSSSLNDFKNILVIFKQLIIKPKVLMADEAVKILVSVSEKAQSMSKQALVGEGKGIGDGFLERSLALMAAGLDEEFVRKTLETDIAEIESRHGNMQNVIRTMGSYAPMFGMTGTVLGVTQVLKNVTDISNIVAGMSLALLTTLYGLILSSVVFIPVSNKLKGRTRDEILTKEIITEGVIMIMQKEIPLKVERYLQAYLASKHKAANE